MPRRIDTVQHGLWALTWARYRLASIPMGGSSEKRQAGSSDFKISQCREAASAAVGQCSLSDLAAHTTPRQQNSVKKNVFNKRICNNTVLLYRLYHCLTFITAPG